MGRGKPLWDTGRSPLLRMTSPASWLFSYIFTLRCFPWNGDHYLSHSLNDSLYLIINLSAGVPTKSMGLDHSQPIPILKGHVLDAVAPDPETVPWQTPPAAAGSQMERGLQRKGPVYTDKGPKFLGLSSSPILTDLTAPWCDLGQRRFISEKNSCSHNI